MKKILLLLSLVLLAYQSYGQTIIEGFNMAKPDTALVLSIEGSKSRLTVTQNTSDKKEGASSVEVNTVIGAYHEWGTYSQLIYKNTDSSTMDWSSSDTISIWIKVKQAPKHPENMVFRIQVSDKPSKADPIEQYIYENAVVLDTLHDWYLLKVPFKELTQPGTTVPNDQGFILAPTSWGGFTYNNRKLDRNKIYDWTIGMITSGYTAGVNLPADSLVVLFDGFQRSGNRAVPVMFFNGKDYDATVVSSPYGWGNAGLTVVQGAGTTSKGNAMEWTLGDQWGSGWNGIGMNIKTVNMRGAWVADTLQFKIKTDADIDTLRAQLESNNARGKRAIKFKVNNDNAWHTYKFALKNMLFDDGAPNFNPDSITALGFMSNGSKYTVGKKIYITEVWSGNPDIDVIPPDAPTSVQATPGAYSNLLTWIDTPNESGAKYNVYLSDKPFTDVDDPTVENLPPFNQPVGVQSIDHVLRYPVTNTNVTRYYRVTATDAAGNVSVPSQQVGPITNVAKGVPTISKVAPTNFKCDGSLSEWSTIPPIVLNSFRNPPTAKLAPNTTAKDSNDISGKIYLAMDAQNFYIAADIVDDTVAVDTTKNSWDQDGLDMFIGLYDWKGKIHTGYKRGAQPDYHLRLAQNAIIGDNPGGILMYQNIGTAAAYVQNPSYVWKKKTLTSGYTIEAIIPWTVLAARYKDSVFVPAEGKRIPIDFELNDRDGLSTRDAQLDYSPLAAGLSYQSGDVWRWTYTWIGDKLSAVKESEAIPGTYALDQNYPNPFNPSTKINYSLPAFGHVSLKVFDVLGREVMTLVNENQGAGVHTVQMNASRLSSGMYIYKLEAGSFSAVKKMMLLK